MQVATVKIWISNIIESSSHYLTIHMDFKYFFHNHLLLFSDFLIPIPFFHFFSFFVSIAGQL